MTSIHSPKKIVVLDRDGTIVVDKRYLHDPDQLELLPNASNGMRLLCNRGYRLIVATNQSGVGRGFFTIDQMTAVNKRLQDMVEAAGASLEAIYSCPHHPAMECDCRKPKVGLMLRAARELYFDPASVFVVGDKESDIEFGIRSSARTILIATPDSHRNTRAEFTARDLLEVATIVENEAGR